MSTWKTFVVDPGIGGGGPGVISRAPRGTAPPHSPSTTPPPASPSRRDDRREPRADDQPRMGDNDPSSPATRASAGATPVRRGAWTGSAPTCSVSTWRSATGSDREPEPRRVDVVAVRHRQDRRHPRQPQPRVPHHELTYACQSGCRLLVAALSFNSSDYIRNGRPDRRPRCRSSSGPCSLEDEWDEIVARRRRRCGSGEPPRRQLAFRRPDQHPVHHRDDGFPKGATLTHHNILNNGYFVARLHGVHERDRVCIPVPLYHCFGMVLGNLCLTTHGACMVLPGEAFDPQATLEAVAAERCTRSTACRRCSSPSSTIRRSAIRPDVAAHRRHGRRAVPGRGDEAGGERHAHAGGDDRLRHDGDFARFHSDAARRPDRAARVDRRAVLPHVEIKIVDPRAAVPHAASRRVLHPRLQRDAGLLDDPRRPPRRSTGGWMHTGDLAVMDDDGYVNIVGRIKDMVIRGGENIYPREIEEFLIRTRRSPTCR